MRQERTDFDLLRGREGTIGSQRFKSKTSPSIKRRGAFLRRGTRPLHGPQTNAPLPNGYFDTAENHLHVHVPTVEAFDNDNGGLPNLSSFAESSSRVDLRQPPPSPTEGYFNSYSSRQNLSSSKEDFHFPSIHVGSGRSAPAGLALSFRDNKVISNVAAAQKLDGQQVSSYMSPRQTFPTGHHFHRSVGAADMLDLSVPPASAQLQKPTRQVVGDRKNQRYRQRDRNRLRRTSLQIGQDESSNLSQNYPSSSDLAIQPPSSSRQNSVIPPSRKSLQQPPPTPMDSHVGPWQQNASSPRPDPSYSALRSRRSLLQPPPTPEESPDVDGWPWDNPIGSETPLYRNHSMMHRQKTSSLGDAKSIVRRFKSFTNPPLSLKERDPENLKYPEVIIWRGGYFPKQIR